MKQTAVEYLFEKLWQMSNDKMVWYYILEKAKQMEKEQIEDAFIDGEHQQGFEGEAEQYYKETYEK